MIKAPGADMPMDSIGTENWNVHVRKEASLVFSQKSFRHWTTKRTSYNSEQRQVDRHNIGEVLKASEAILFPHMSILVTQKGANLRAYQFLRNQDILGLRKVERITLLEVKEVLDQIVEWKWSILRHSRSTKSIFQLAEVTSIRSPLNLKEGRDSRCYGRFLDMRSPWPHGRSRKRWNSISKY